MSGTTPKQLFPYKVSDTPAPSGMPMHATLRLFVCTACTLCCLSPQPLVAQKGWTIVHPAAIEVDRRSPYPLVRQGLERRWLRQEKHSRDDILRELVERYQAEKDVEIAQIGRELLYVYRWTPADVVGPELSVTKTEHLVGEPVSITFTWTNDSEEAMKFPTQFTREYSTIHVSVDGDEFREFTLPGGIVPRLVPSDVFVTYLTASFAPRETYSVTVLVLKGRPDESEEDFLLSRPGRYTFRANPNDERGVHLEVRLPSREQDKLAFAHWRDRAAAQFPLFPEWIVPDLEPLEDLIAKYPKSVYAQYARLAVARHLVMHDAFRGEEARKRATAYAECLVYDRPNPPLVEHALGLASFWGGIDECRRAAIQIQQINPKSGFLDSFRIMSPMLMRPPPNDDTRPVRKSPRSADSGLWGKETARLLAGVVLLALAVGAAIWLRGRKPSQAP